MDNQLFNRYVGERIKHHRKAERYSLQGIADLMGVSRQSVSSWEKGISPVTVFHLWLLSNILRIDISELIPNKRQIVVSTGEDNQAKVS